MYEKKTNNTITILAICGLSCFSKGCLPCHWKHYKEEGGRRRKGGQKERGSFVGRLERGSYKGGKVGR